MLQYIWQLDCFNEGIICYFTKKQDAVFIHAAGQEILTRFHSMTVGELAS